MQSKENIDRYADVWTAEGAFLRRISVRSKLKDMSNVRISVTTDTIHPQAGNNGRNPYLSQHFCELLEIN